MGATRPISRRGWRPACCRPSRAGGGTGSTRSADAAMPTFTNPNNLSIVTGAPPAVHGISGNFALDRDSGAEIMMTDPEMVRGDTILGADVAGRGRGRRGHREGQIAPHARQGDRDRRRHRETAASAFRPSRPIAAPWRSTASTASRRWSAVPKPDMYSADLSLFVLDAGIRLVEQGRAELLVPVAVRLRAARPCPGRTRGARLPRRARRSAGAAGGARLHRRADRRSRHERQGASRRPAACASFSKMC